MGRIGFVCRSGFRKSLLIGFSPSIKVMVKLKNSLKSSNQLIIKFTYLVVFGGFSSKLGLGEKDEEKRTGIGNDRCDKMAAMADADKQFICNTGFRRKAWFWKKEMDVRIQKM